MCVCLCSRLALIQLFELWSLMIDCMNTRSQWLVLLAGSAWGKEETAARLINERLGPPVEPFYPFSGEGSPTKIDYRKKGYPYSNLSTGGPRRTSRMLSDFPGGSMVVRIHMYIYIYIYICLLYVSEVAMAMIPFPFLMGSCSTLATGQVGWSKKLHLETGA